MIDVTTENLITLSKAARDLPSRNGKRGINNSTVWRWTVRGIRGVKLETVLVGGTRFTSQQALNRFFHASTAAAAGVVVPAVRTSAQRQRAIDRAEEELIALGM